MPDNHVYLVTGANRGIGLEFARQILRNPQNRLIAGARQVDADSLKKLQTEHGSRLLRVQIDLLDFATIAVLYLRVIFPLKMPNESIH